MKKVKTILLLLCLIGASTPLFAQQETDLSKERLEECKLLAKRKIDDLLQFIRQITDKSLPMEQRRNAIRSAMQLFVATYIDDNGVERSPTIQVSRKNGQIITLDLKSYFNKLLTLRFDDVKVSSYDVATVSDFEKGTDNKYHATGHYFQDFKGYQNRKLVNHSQDKKKVSITGESMKVYEDIGKDMLKIYFGNIVVEETKNNPVN